MPAAAEVIIVRMACGHVTRDHLENGRPVCSQCLGLDPGALVPQTRAPVLVRPPDHAVRSAS